MTIALFDSIKDDFVALAALHAPCFADAWTAEAIAGLLATPGTFAFAGADGFVLARAAGGEAEILTLAVTPSARRQGFGRALLLAAARHAQGLGAEVMFLEVGSDNQAALALYAGLGFQRVGMRKAYYDNDSQGPRNSQRSWNSQGSRDSQGSGPGRDALILKAALPLSPGPEFA
jgi:ribosomal-protein-alanine N-acetyltransferase